MMAKHKKIKTQIRYMGSTRDRCSKCKAPSGFCIHTIEEQYKKYCREFDDFWFPTRLLAIAETEKENISKYCDEKDAKMIYLGEYIKTLEKELEHYHWIDDKLKLIQFKKV